MKVFAIKVQVRHAQLGWNWLNSCGRTYRVLASDVERAIKIVKRKANKPVLDDQDGGKHYKCTRVDIERAEELCELD